MSAILLLLDNFLPIPLLKQKKDINLCIDTVQSLRTLFFSFFGVNLSCVTRDFDSSMNRGMIISLRSTSIHVETFSFVVVEKHAH